MKMLSISLVNFRISQPPFKGAFNPEETWRWLKNTENIFHVIECNDAQGVRLSVFKLINAQRARLSVFKLTDAQIISDKRYN
jgi:hypothetical protein